MRALLIVGWLALLVACAPVYGTRVFVENFATGQRTDLVRQEGAADIYSVELGEVGISVSGLGGSPFPDVLVARTRISYDASRMYVVFGSAPSLTLALRYDRRRLPNFDDFKVAAFLADALQVCTSPGGCAKLDGSPLINDDIVLVRLP